jgi:hypothetical protein
MMESVGYDFIKFQELLKTNFVDYLGYLQYMKQKGEIEETLKAFNRS